MTPRTSRARQRRAALRRVRLHGIRLPLWYVVLEPYLWRLVWLLWLVGFACGATAVAVLYLTLRLLVR